MNDLAAEARKLVERMRDEGDNYERVGKAMNPDGDGSSQEVSAATLRYCADQLAALLDAADPADAQPPMPSRR